MNLEEQDIEQSKSYLQTLIENQSLHIETRRLSEFVDFIIDKVDPDLQNKTLLKTIQSYSLEELNAIEKNFIEANLFDHLITNSFQIEKRKELKKRLKQLDTELAEASLDKKIKEAFQIEKRKELKENLRALENDSELGKPKVFSIKPYLRVISIAASIILIFLVWQPQHSSDKKLFTDYTSELNDNSIADFTRPELIQEQNGLRGEEEHIKNYTYDETEELLGAIRLVKQKEFQRAKEIFNNLHIRKEANPGLALYLAVAQLNSGDENEAIEILEYLNKLSNFPYGDEVRFHLAFAYLKSDDRKKAKDILRQLVNNKSRFADEAQRTLKKIRWF